MSGIVYKGFISYAHRNKKVAQRIHRALESFRVARGINGTPNGALGKFFRDDEELAASNSLADSVAAALDQAEFLIVLCSPAAATSTWVGSEIEHFRKSGRGRSILAIIIDGQPNTPDAERECLPAAFRRRDESDAMPVEPLAIDLRQEGLNRAVTKVAAALLGVSFDQLWNRTQRRLRRRRMALAAGAFAMAGLAVAAGVNAWRNEAQRQYNAEREIRRTADAIDEIEIQARLHAARANQESAPTDATLIALEAWSAPDPRGGDMDLDRYLTMPAETRIAQLNQDWTVNRLNEPDRGAAAAQLRRGLANMREVWARDMGPGFHELALSPDGNILVHAQEDNGITLLWLDTPDREVRITGYGYARAMTFAPDGQTLYIAAKLGLLELDLVSGRHREIARFTRETENWGTALNIEHGYALIRRESSEVFTISLDDGRMQRLPVDGLQAALVWNGGRALIGNKEGLYTFDPATGRGGPPLGTGPLRRLFRVSDAEADILAMVDAQDQVLVTDLASQRQMQFEVDDSSEDYRTQLLYDPVHSRVFVHGGGSTAHAQGFDDERRELLSCGRNIEKMDIDTAARVLGAISDNGEICVWSLDTLARIATFETREELLNIVIRGDLVVFSDKRGMIRAQRWQSGVQAARLEDCAEEYVQGIIFSFTGETLLGPGGFMGLCTWDVTVDPPRLYHAPSIKATLTGVPFSKVAPRMVVTDRFGAVFEVTLPDLAPLRRVPLPDETVAIAALYVDAAHSVLVHDSENRLHLVRDGAAPLTLTAPFDGLTAHSSALTDTHLAVLDGAGDVHVFDAIDGTHLSEIDLPAPIVSAGLDARTGDLAIVLINPTRNFRIARSDLSGLPQRIVGPADTDAIVPFEAGSSELPMLLAFAPHGTGVIVDVAANAVLYSLEPERIGAASIRDMTIQFESARHERLAAALALDSFADAPFVSLLALPDALTRYYHPDVEDDLAPLDGDAYRVSRAMWEREAERRLFRLATQTVGRCLSSEQRRRLQLDSDPPCWCAEKNYPTISAWRAALGRDPFSEPRADGNVCTPAAMKPWEVATDALD